MATDSKIDSGSDGLGQGSGSTLFTDRANTYKTKMKRPGLSLLMEKGLEKKDEVVESKSPSGHINERRALVQRRKELLLSASNTPMTKEHAVCLHFYKK